MVPNRRLVVIVGNPGSGKDLLIRAVHDLGAQHARIIPKHTSRQKRDDDRQEMICPENPEHNLVACDIRYQNYGDEYGIESVKIWEALSDKVFPVVVVSNVEAINQLHNLFGELILLVYVHSQVSAEKYRQDEAEYGKDAGYIERRVAEYRRAFEIYLKNMLAFDHVLINSGLPENLYDQIFRLFRAYERGDLPSSPAKPLISEKV
jgi:guanylate kinase